MQYKFKLLKCFLFLWPGGRTPKIDGQWRGPTRPHMLRMPKNGTGLMSLWVFRRQSLAWLWNNRVLGRYLGVCRAPNRITGNQLTWRWAGLDGRDWWCRDWVEGVSKETNRERFWGSGITSAGFDLRSTHADDMNRTSTRWLRDKHEIRTMWFGWNEDVDVDDSTLARVNQRFILDSPEIHCWLTWVNKVDSVCWLRWRLLW